jgi:hypothetical protein
VEQEAPLPRGRMDQFWETPEIGSNIWDHFVKGSNSLVVHHTAFSQPNGAGQDRR